MQSNANCGPSGAPGGDTVIKVASGAYDLGVADLYSMVRFNGEMKIVQ
jgi:hypothetical protein